MKKAILLFLFALMGLNMILYAAKWRVSNVSGVNANFHTAQAVNDSSSVLAGDTVYFEGSVNSYGDLTLSKRLVIIGPGYFLGENDSTQANMLSASLGTVIINPGAENSVITGIATNNFYLRCDNILLKRDQLSYTYIGDAGAVSNIFILQSWVYQAEIYSGQNLILKNNIFSNSNSGNYCVWMNYYTSASFLNNIFQTHCRFQDSEIRNNIFSVGNDVEWVGTCTVTNNISGGGCLPNGNGNQNYINMATVFMYSGSSDGQYKLKQGSPAIGAGYGGVDCGVFGGSAPYVLSGLPTVPAIWKLDVDGSTVTLKAKSH